MFTLVFFLQEEIKPNATHFVYQKMDPHQVCERADISQVQKVLETNIDIDVRDSEGRTLLMRAIDGKKKDAILLLIDRKADINARDRRGLSVIGRVAYYEEFIDILSLLIQKGADVNSRDNEYWTPLMDAVLNGNAPGVRILLQNGADVNARDSKGRTALMHAIQGGNAEIAALLQ